MRIVLITEHYKPRVGGITSFVTRIVGALEVRGHEVWLLFPGEQGIHEVVEQRKGKVTDVCFGASIDLTGSISSKARKRFCKEANEWIVSKQYKLGFEVIHVMFGLYLMKYFELKRINSSIRKGCTIHNIPPRECDKSWETDRLDLYIKDLIRKRIVYYINRRRILAQKWDYFVVPSVHVREILVNWIKYEKIVVVNHGCEYNMDESISNLNRKLSILTISGFTPHKRQHWIPELALMLKMQGIDFVWNVVGPNKHERYTKYIESAIRIKGLNDCVNLHFAISDRDLDRIKRNSHLYVHPSKEEGFCLAFLEVMMNKIPGLGIKTGSIAEFIKIGNGFLVEDNIESFANGLIEMIKNISDFNITNKEVNNLGRSFNWLDAAKKYENLWL